MFVFNQIVPSNAYQKANLIALFGDSITEQNSLYENIAGAEKGFFYSDGYGVWAQALGGYRYNFARRSNGNWNFGFSGFKIEDLLGSPLLEIAASPCKVVVELSGTNNVIQGIQTSAQIAALRITLWQALQSCGKRVVALGLPPLGTVQRTTQTLEINEICKNAAASLNVTFVDPPAALYSGNVCNSDYFRDDIHPNIIGAKVIGETLNTALDNIVATSQFTFPESNSNRWLTLNPYVTGGTTIATNWSIPFNPAGGTWTPSKITDEYGVWQRITCVDPNVAGSWVQSNQVATVAAGSYIQVVAKLRTSNIRLLGVRYTYNSVERGTCLRLPATAINFSRNPLDLGEFMVTAASPTVTIPTGGSAIQIHVFAYGSGTFDFQTAGVISSNIN